MIQIHLTTGDEDGIGLEVTVKALIEIQPKKNIQFILWRNRKEPNFLQPNLVRLKELFHTQNFNNYPEQKISQEFQLIDIQSKDTATQWVRQASLLCLQNPESMALVTAPLSKTQMQKDGFPFVGHTDFLKHLSGIKNLYMCFLGEKFNVVLVTDHQPLKDIRISSSDLNDVIKHTLSFRKYVDKKYNKPIGLLGINPHAGEKGLLGKEEQDIFPSVVQKWSGQVEGPLVPDVAFSPCFWDQYSFYLCMYHDQGLIPFKMIHQRTGVHTTLALPFVRTSVDHGTAKDIFGNGQADFLSMKKAIETAVDLVLMKKSNEN